METRTIPGFDGYSVTDTGVIIGRHGRPLAFYIDKDGYRRVTLATERGKNSPRTHIGIHQAVCLAFNGCAPSVCHEVKHNDGTKDNNTPDNLLWATHLDNIRDKHTHGTIRLGSSHPMSKLSDQSVLDIRWGFRMGSKVKDLAEIYGVSRDMIGRIVRRQNWKHLPEVGHGVA